MIARWVRVLVTAAAGGGGDAWAPLADRFVDGHYGSLRGRVRTYVIDQHLAPTWRRPAGHRRRRRSAGHQSVPLARAGYDVTIVDPSAAMLDRRAC